jgi:hypothetical protein
MFYSNCTEMQSYTMWIPSIMAKMKSWKEPKNRCWRMPMTALDVQETITAVKEAQQTVVIQLSAWLRLQSDAAVERLNVARERESECLISSRGRTMAASTGQWLRSANIKRNSTATAGQKQGQPSLK